jgi:hypothetical protein
VLISWLLAAINDLPLTWLTGLPFLLLGWMVWQAYKGDWQAERKLESRRQRLSELLETHNASE